MFFCPDAAKVGTKKTRQKKSSVAVEFLRVLCKEVAVLNASLRVLPFFLRVFESFLRVFPYPSVSSSPKVCSPIF